MPKFIDKTGLSFGSLTVISRAENKNKYVYWNCKCSCGKECVIRGDKLTQSHVDGKGAPSCGHIRIERVVAAVSNDLVGQTFGRLTVIKKTEKRYSNGTYIWKCKCSCGNEVELPTDSLTKKDRPTRSCGCLQREAASMIMSERLKNIIPKIGDNINGFVVQKVKIEPTNNKQNETWIYCSCPFCQKERWFQTRYIKNGDTKSCGCISGSAGEKKIENILKENNIKFEREKKFDDLRDVMPLRFDFFIENKYVVEFDGQQHFEPQKFGNITEKEANTKFILNIKHDKLKNNYCHKNNIPIIRIPYTHYNDLCLKDLLLETSKFIL